MVAVPFGEGEAVIDPADGAVVALRHPARPGAPWLLDEATESWHSREHRWGTGLAITSAGAGRWGAPAALAIDGARIEARHAIAPGLELHVTRELGATWRERYALRNTTADPVGVGSWAICTPWRDLYATAADALARAVHAHVHAGGAYAYTLAEPMDGTGPVLGLVVREGELWAYSIESREPHETGSSDFAPDGTATAAFVLPSCVSGRAAHRADPLANDQEWALYWPLRLTR